VLKMDIITRLTYSQQQTRVRLYRPLSRKVANKIHPDNVLVEISFCIRRALPIVIWDVLGSRLSMGMDNKSHLNAAIAYTTSRSKVFPSQVRNCKHSFPIRSWVDLPHHVYKPFISGITMPNLLMFAVTLHLCVDSRVQLKMGQRR
jgi:hypothetical protein